MKKFFFETPVIIGDLCDGHSAALRQAQGAAQRAIGVRLARHAKKIAYLPFQVRREHLKNTIACMQLMDIAAITVSGRHRTCIARHLPHMEREAKAARFVDSVIRRGNKFVGHSAVGESVLGWLARRRIAKARRIAIAIGKSEIMPAICGALKSGGWRLAPTNARRPSVIIAGALSVSDRRRIFRHIDEAGRGKICLIDLENSCAKHSPRVTRLGKREFLDNFYHTTAMLLTSGI